MYEVVNNSKNVLCRLCLEISGGNFYEIKDTIKEVINILLPKLNLDEETSHLICTVCFRKLKAALNFKSKCLDTEDSIFPYIYEEMALPIDLKEVYMREKGNEQSINPPMDYEICRLCMQLVYDELTALCNVEVNIISRYIPELNFDITKNPVICTPCLDSLNINSSFIKDCLDADERFDNDFDNKVVDNPLDAPFSDWSIKTEEIVIKSEDDQNDTETLIETNKIGKNGEERSRGTSKTSRHQTKPKGNLKRHTSIRKSSKVWYDCNICNYKTKWRQHLTRHILKHKPLSEVEWYECNVCSLKTKYKTSLKMHMSIHKHPSEIQWLECNMCDYKAKIKSSLEKHMITHNSSVEIQWHECNLCSFKTKVKGNLKSHMGIHNSTSEIRQFRCDLCNFITRHKNCLEFHMLQHKTPSQIEWFPCNLCSYKGKRKDLLRMHMLVHKPPSEVTWYNCNSCDYKTKRKPYLKHHKELHKNPSEIKWFQCNFCDHKTIHSCNLKRHMLLHKSKDIRDEGMYRQN